MLDLPTIARAVYAQNPARRYQDGKPQPFTSLEAEGKRDIAVRQAKAVLKLVPQALAGLERGPRRKVSDPIYLPGSKLEHELVVRPCSTKHRGYFLSGALVLSCSKCSLERIELAA